MNLDKRLQSVASFVPQGCTLADIGTDHAYLPVWLLKKNLIAKAVAGDIAAGPCQAARNTVAVFGVQNKVQVRQGSGLKVLQAGEADCVAICGMGGSTIISILEADMEIAASVKRLVLQPMAGAPGLRQWLIKHGWRIIAEDLVDEPPHFYEIICVERGADENSKNYVLAEYFVGPTLVRQGHALLAKQFARQINGCKELLQNMARSEKARVSAKYQETEALLQNLEVLANEKSNYSR